MKRKLLIPALVFLAVIHASQSQETQNPVPVQIVTLPESFSFTKRYSYPASQKSEKTDSRIVPRVEKIEVVVTGTLSKKMEHFLDGSFTETWKSGTTEYLLNSSMPDRVMITNVETRSNGEPAPVNAEFPEFDWVTAAIVPTKKVRDGITCVVYRSEDKTVWLKEKTRLPVFLKTPTLQITYTFQSPPDQPLQLPEKYAEKLESAKKAWTGRKD